MTENTCKRMTLSNIDKIAEDMVFLNIKEIHERLPKTVHPLDVLGISIRSTIRSLGEMLLCVIESENKKNKMPAEKINSLFDGFIPMINSLLERYKEIAIERSNRNS